ncbi:MAG: hypothetical protein Q7K71_06585 [Candidatus Omnitrophota bacterium]|nr:hypothetical protein [Candidatus Omnitrophota bacterium]
MIAPLLLVLFFSGCVQVQMLPHLDEALTLRSFSAQKDEQHQYVRDADARFDKLLAAVQSGDIKKYNTKKDIVRAFGEPVLTKDIVIDGLPSTYGLYRHAIGSKAKQKVYLYFNAQGQLTYWESI